MSLAQKQKLLSQIEAEIIQNNVCPDLAREATQLVFADGPADAEVVLVGEAPGKNEDLLGKPFVGAAGKFLDQMLEQVGLSRDRVYITNIVKYRPPANRDPLPEEKQAFLPYLLRQLEVIKPKLLVTLGRHSSEAFLQGMKISEIHGKAFRKTFNLVTQEKKPDKELISLTDFSVKLVVLPLYHPAAALYNGSMRQTLIEDFNLIPKLLEKLER